MKGRPDTNAENPQYLAEMVEVLAHLTPEEHAWLTDPRTGLHTVCKFLPTPADVHEFLRGKRERMAQFQPAATVWRKIEEDPNAPWNRETDFERKKRVVRELLGYDPDEAGIPARRTLVEPTLEDLRNLQLKTPAAPASPHLVALLKAQGWPIVPDENR